MTTHTYGTTSDDFTVGMRVELHPASGLWMQGARFGTVVKVYAGYVSVQLDHGRPGISHRFAPDFLRILDETPLPSILDGADGNGLYPWMDYTR